ncbi:MAG: replication-relaxation family protein [Dehalococcoidia bacterium]
MPALTQKEHQTLKAIGVLLYAEHRHLYRYLPYAPGKIREATASLVRQKYLFLDLKQEVRKQAGAVPCVYSLDTKGKEYLRSLSAKESSNVPPGKPAKKKWDFQNHILHISDLIVTIKDYCNQTGGLIARDEDGVFQLFHDLYLKQYPIKQSPGSARPDLWTTIATSGRARHLWWEVDLGTERDQRRWAEKIVGIADAFDDALARFSVPTMTVVLIAPSAARAVRIAEWTRATLGDHSQLLGSFRFTIEERMEDPENFLDGRHWLALNGAFGFLPGAMDSP